MGWMWLFWVFIILLLVPARNVRRPQVPITGFSRLKPHNGTGPPQWF